MKFDPQGKEVDGNVFEGVAVALTIEALAIAIVVAAFHWWTLS